MDTKLTLKLDKDIIEKAKEYAAKQNKSLSSIIESFLQVLTLENKEEKANEIKISPFVKSLSVKSNIPADLDYKKELGDYYAERYK
ncbi:DUF6364 family protein [Flavobacterium subsaxonicum]|uniref:Antitoxin n=1 Tax=Flavobacterium subsaxonicum WB 4.1-42 = DSM 21790 TaxID=1121898 RepID=A0A0A2MIM0_9FLAO|nr:DUF6364 family protein [Flavobacterium subsaxonicum]KGO92129.1 hypothetical protein Q766_14665 [Flavobacterium subsaxonicum WB 4.1-42 = DSM 21790]